MNFTGIPSNEIHFYWHDLCSLLRKPLHRTPAGRYYAPEDVLMKCMDKKWQCWVAWGEVIECVFITYLRDYPTGYKEFCIYLVGGQRIDEWLQIAWERFKMYAIENDCDEMVGFGRKGWLRKLKSVEPADFEQHLSFSVKV